MLKINYVHICETVILDQSGKLSLIGIFENFNAEKFPAIHPQMYMLANFEADKPGLYDVELIFKDEQGEILKTNNKIKIGDNLKGNWVNKMVAYNIPRELTQMIMINYEGKNIYKGYLTVNNK